MVAATISVMQVLPELNTGGVERGTLELARHLVSEGHRSLVVSAGGRLVPQLEHEGSRHIQLAYIGEKTPRCLLHLLPLRQLIQKGKGGLDVLHLRSRLPAWVAFAAWKSLPVRKRPLLITTFHGYYSVNAYSAIMTRGQKVIAISEAIADHLRRSYRTPADKIKVIHRGIDPKLFRPEHVNGQRIERLRHLWGCLGTDTPVIVLPARVTWWKGHDLFIRALSHLSDLPWTAVCVGDYEPGSTYFQSLKQLLAATSLSERIRFTGHEEDMPAVYAAADVVVSAASAEPEAFGRVAVEAQAMQRPIIASAHGGSMETVLHDRTGWLFAPGDESDLAGCLRQALVNPHLRSEFGRNGFAHVHARFTLQRMCTDTVTLYRELLPSD